MDLFIALIEIHNVRYLSMKRNSFANVNKGNNVAQIEGIAYHLCKGIRNSLLIQSVYLNDGCTASFRFHLDSMNEERNDNMTDAETPFCTFSSFQHCFAIRRECLRWGSVTCTNSVDAFVIILGSTR